jgi:hypothetical protein
MRKRSRAEALLIFLSGVAINSGKSDEIESLNEEGAGGEEGEKGGGVTCLILCQTIMAILVHAHLTLLRTVRHRLTASTKTPHNNQMGWRHQGHEVQANARQSRHRKKRQSTGVGKRETTGTIGWKRRRRQGLP